MSQSAYTHASGLRTKSLHDFEVGIGHPSVLIGPNGSGKTGALDLVRLWRVRVFAVWGLVLLPGRRASLRLPSMGAGATWPEYSIRSSMGHVRQTGLGKEIQ